MQAFSTVLELFGRLTGLRDPAVPLPADSPLAGGKIPPPVLGRDLARAGYFVEEPATIAEEPGAAVEPLGPPPATGQPEQATPAVPQLYEIVPNADGQRVSVCLPHNSGMMTVGLTHDEARKLMEALLNFYGLPPNFHE